MNTVSKRLIALLFVVGIFIVTLSAVQAQDPTKAPRGGGQVTPVPTLEDDGSGTSQLRIDYDPMLGMNLFALSRAPDYFRGTMTASGDNFVDLGGDCAAGFTSPESALGLAWIEDSGPVDIQFVPSRRGQQTALILWEVIDEQWWCTFDFAEINSLQFDNLAQGIDFVWVLTEDGSPVSGELSVISPPQ
jgi:hypothetical protein